MSNAAHRILPVSFVCLVALGLGACFSAPPVTYYSLFQTHQSAKNQSGPLGHLTLLIGPVSLPESLQTSQIVTGKNGVFTRSAFHRWSGELDNNFARSLGEQLSEDLGTENILIFPGNSAISPDYQIMIDILSMGGNLGESAEMTVRWAVIDRKNKTKPIFTKSHYSEYPGSADYTSWVVAQRHNLIQLGKEISKTIKRLY